MLCVFYNLVFSLRPYFKTFEKIAFNMVANKNSKERLIIKKVTEILKEVYSDKNKCFKISFACSSYNVLLFSIT